MIVEGLEAAKIAAAALRSTEASVRSKSSSSDFSTVLANVVEQAVKSVPAAETLAKSGIVGEKAPQKVVMAILEAERNLQTVVAVRDKVVAAYQEISRMPI